MTKQEWEQLAHLLRKSLGNWPGWLVGRMSQPLPQVLGGVEFVLEQIRRDEEKGQGQQAAGGTSST